MPTVLAEVTSLDVTSLTSSVTTMLKDFTTSNLFSIISSALAIAVPLIIGWFIFRYLYRTAKGALRKGK